MAKEIRPIGIEHLSETFSSSRAGCGFYTLGLDISVKKHSNSAYGLLGIFKKGNQLRYGLPVATTLDSCNGMVQFPVKTLWANRTDIEQYVFGFRYKKGSKAATMIIGLILDAVTTDTAAKPDTIIYSIPAGSDEGYYEFRLVPYDFTDRGIQVYKDGELITTVVVSSNWVRSLLASRCWFTIGTAASTVWTGAADLLPGEWAFSMEDIYSAWSTDRTEKILQGPIRIKRLPYSEVSPASWTVQGGKTPLEVLNLTSNSFGDRTDYLVSDLANTTLKAKLDLSGLKSTDQVKALVLTSNAWRDGGTTGTLSTKVTHTDGESPAVSYAPTTGAWNTQYDVPIANLTTTPGGAALTKASMAALELVVTPSP